MGYIRAPLQRIGRSKYNPFSKINRQNDLFLFSFFQVIFMNGLFYLISRSMFFMHAFRFFITCSSHSKNLLSKSFKKSNYNLLFQ